jgi:anti-sigma regulatory factor (Ser/Thr protein kinase)
MATVTVPAQTEQLGQLTELLHQQLEGTSCPSKTVLALELVLEEAFVNIATHAYTREGGMVSFSCQVDKQLGLVTLCFKDQGVPFDPLTRQEPDITLSAAERPIGGLGIYLIKKTMDKCNYVYDRGCNILTLTKRIR